MSQATFHAAGDVAILVPSCDRYAELWGPFLHCFHTHWPDCPFPVYLGTNHGTLGRDAAATPHSEGATVHVIQTGPDISYADNLRLMLDQVRADWVIVWVDDRFLTAAVQTGRLRAVIMEAQHRRFGYVKLVPQPPFAYSASPAEMIGALPIGMPYRASFTIGLWRRDVLLSVLRPGESAWELERGASQRSAGNACPFGALSPAFRRKPLLPHQHVLIKGRLVRDALPFLRRIGALEQLAHRKIEPWTSVAYVRLYYAFFDVVRRWQYHRLRRDATQAEAKA